METMAMRHRNDGLTKQCSCGRSKWAKCKHPWHFSFYKKRCACPTTCACAGNRVRISLHKVAKKPLTYWMSKSEAEGHADALRGQVRDGTAIMQATGADTRLTLADVADRYFEKHVRRPGRRERPIKAVANYLRIIKSLEVPAGRGRTAKLGAKPIAEVTTADIDATREARRKQLHDTFERRERAIAEGRKTGRIVLPGSRGGEVGIEHMMGTLRNLFEWAVVKGHVDATPFKRNGITAVKLRVQKKIHRTRRLDADSREEDRLLAAAQPHMKDLIVAALESACRCGELLSLQWWQVRTKGGALHHLDLPADKTKTTDPRRVPITPRLRAILEYRRTGPDGKEHGPDAYVFGNEVGEMIGRVYTAWRATCRRAKVEGLTFHDLRHEAISRMLDKGMPIHKVRAWAGHRSIATTGIYANAGLGHLEDEMWRFEGAPHKTEVSGSVRSDNGICQDG
jgi:integrase